MACGAALCLSGACNLDNPGVSPPEGVLSYPFALAVSDFKNETGAPKFLYVANTNFDLRYNGARVQSYDLDKLGERVSRCIGRDVSVPSPDPDPDAAVDIPDAQVDAGPDAEVDAAVDAGMDAADGADPDAEVDSGMDAADGADLDAAEPDATDLDADLDASASDARLPAVDAGQADIIIERTLRGNLCDGRSRDDAGNLIDPEDENACCFTTPDSLHDLRTDEMLIDSFATGLAVLPAPSDEAEDDGFLYVPVRSKNRLVYLGLGRDGSLRCGEETGRCTRGPKLGTEVLDHDEEDFAPSPSAVVTGAFKDLGVEDSTQDFVVTAHDTGEIGLYSVNPKNGAPTLLNVGVASAARATSVRLDPVNKLLYVGAAGARSVVQRVGVRTVGGMTPDQSPERPVVYPAEPLVINGLSGAFDVRDVLHDSRPAPAGGPLRAYALVRGDAAGLVLLQSVAFLELPTEETDGRLARAVDAVRVGLGASKLVQADIGDRHLLFASCYDASEIHIIDADRRQTVTVIRDVVGPFDMQVDVTRQLLYVTDYRVSVVRVVDIHGLFERSTAAPRVVATLGAPITPGSIR